MLFEGHLRLRVIGENQEHKIVLISLPALC